LRKTDGSGGKAGALFSSVPLCVAAVCKGWGAMASINGVRLTFVGAGGRHAPREWESDRKWAEKKGAEMGRPFPNQDTSPAVPRGGRCACGSVPCYVEVAVRAAPSLVGVKVAVRAAPSLVGVKTGPRPRAFHERGASCARTLRLYAVPRGGRCACGSVPSWCEEIHGVKKYMV
jgi:hypothetical protein